MDVRQLQQCARSRSRRDAAALEDLPEVVLGQRQLAEPHQREGLAEAGAGACVLDTVTGLTGVEQLDRPFVDRVGLAVVAEAVFLVPLQEQGLGVAAARLEGFELLQVHDVGKRLDGDVEDVGQDPQLVEGGITDSLLVAGELRVVDVPAALPGLLLDLAQGVTVACPQPLQVAAELDASFECLHDLLEWLPAPGLSLQHCH